MPYIPFNQQFFCFKQSQSSTHLQRRSSSFLFCAITPFCDHLCIFILSTVGVNSNPLKYQNTHPQHCCFSQKTMSNTQMSKSLSSVNTLTHHPIVSVNPVAFKVLYYTQLQYYFQSKTDFKTKGAAVSNDGSFVTLLYQPPITDRSLIRIPSTGQQSEQNRSDQ